MRNQKQIKQQVFNQRNKLHKELFGLSEEIDGERILEVNARLNNIRDMIRLTSQGMRWSRAVQLVRGEN